MNKREKLLRDKNYIVAQMQLALLNMVGNYKDQKKLKDYQLAEELGVSKGYVSQLLNATFDHKLSKVVDLAIACNKMPLLYFVNLDEFVDADLNNRKYDIMQAYQASNETFEKENSFRFNYLSFFESVQQKPTLEYSLTN